MSGAFDRTRDPPFFWASLSVGNDCWVFGAMAVGLAHRIVTVRHQQPVMRIHCSLFWHRALGFSSFGAYPCIHGVWFCRVGLRCGAP
eukprot:4679543-Lingulodinium_polyedra.AAC.1